MLLVLIQKGIERRPTRDVRGRWGRQIHPAWQFDCNPGYMLLVLIQKGIERRPTREIRGYQE